MGCICRLFWIRLFWIDLLGTALLSFVLIGYFECLLVLWFRFGVFTCFVLFIFGFGLFMCFDWVLCVSRFDFMVLELCWCWFCLGVYVGVYHPYYNLNCFVCWLYVITFGVMCVWLDFSLQVYNGFNMGCVAWLFVIL